MVINAGIGVAVNKLRIMNQTTLLIGRIIAVQLDKLQFTNNLAISFNILATSQ